MEYREFKKALFDEASAAGCEAAETFFVRGESFEANVLGGEIDQYEVNRFSGLNLMVKVDGRNGYAYTETLDGAAALVARAADNARSIENDDDHPMRGASEYPKLTEKPLKCDSLSERDKIELARKLERATLAGDKRIQRLAFCTVQSGESETFISNTLGLEAHGKKRIFATVAVPVSKDGDDIRNGGAIRSNDGALDYEDCAREAVAEAVALHGASPVPAGKYRVLIRYDAMRDMLAAFSSMFSAENAQKGLSLLKDKLGEKVASDSVTITDDPLLPENPRAFDDEGVPSVRTAVVENGVLRSFLHNLKTAKKAGVDSTSNGGRPGAASPVGIMPSNLLIEKGASSYDELVEKLGDGLIITEVSGLHAGLNPVSGEFSLIASGRLVEGGKIIRPVDQITVGGSFIELMKSVEAVGNDMRFGVPGDTMIGSPSVLVESLMVSGK